MVERKQDDRHQGRQLRAILNRVPPASEHHNVDLMPFASGYHGLLS